MSQVIDHPKPAGDGWAFEDGSWIRRPGRRLSPAFPFYCDRFEVPRLTDGGIVEGCSSPKWVPKALREGGDLFPNPLNIGVSLLFGWLVYKAIFSSSR